MTATTAKTPAIPHWSGPATPGVLLMLAGGTMVIWSLNGWGVLPERLAGVKSALPASELQNQGSGSFNGNKPVGTNSNVSHLSRYSYADLQELWIQAGGDPSKAPLAAAVAMAESQGDPNAYNAKDPNGGSRGLWQINGVHGSKSTLDPMDNARAAVSISSNGTKWNAWSTYVHETYKKYLDYSIKPAVSAVTNATTVVKIATDMIGTTPYVLGGTTPGRGMDCSGYVQYVYNKVGIKLPRLANQQATVGTAVDKANLQAGDLVFFKDTYKSSAANHVTHVGIYLGGGKFVNECCPSAGIIIQSLNDSYYKQHYWGARRVL